MDNFEVLEEIGKGSYSTVYKVKCTKDKKFYALKKEETNDFYNVNEIDFLSKCRHPNILYLIDLFYTHDDKNTFSNLILPLAESDLRSFIRRLTDEKNLMICLMFQIGVALNFIHSKNLIYGDLKPSNILIFYENKKIIPKLSDFNLMFNEFNSLEFTGSPLFTSPQGLEPKHKSEKIDIYFEPLNNIQADIFSLGCVFLFIYTKGRYISDLFNSNSLSICEIYNHFILNYSSLLFSYISDEDFYHLLLQMLSPSQKERFKSVKEILNHSFFKDKIPEEIDSLRGQGIFINRVIGKIRMLDFSFIQFLIHPKLKIKENTNLIRTLKKIYFKCIDIKIDDKLVLASCFLLTCRYHNLLRGYDIKEISKIFNVSKFDLILSTQTIIVALKGSLF